MNWFYSSTLILILMGCAATNTSRTLELVGVESESVVGKMIQRRGNIPPGFRTEDFVIQFAGGGKYVEILINNRSDQTMQIIWAKSFYLDEVGRKYSMKRFNHTSSTLTILPKGQEQSPLLSKRGVYSWVCLLKWPLKNFLPDNLVGDKAGMLWTFKIGKELQSFTFRFQVY